MAWFITAIILAFIMLGWFVFAPNYYTTKQVPTGEYDHLNRQIVEKERISHSSKKYGFFLLPLIILSLTFSCFAIVGAKNVGVPTVFGKTTGDTYGAGLNFKPPWVSVTDIDATVQPEEYNGDDCIYVKIADAGSACISLAYRWRINPDGADTAYVDYRNAEEGVQEAIRKALVSTNIKAAINEVFGSYNPLEGADITADMTPQQIANLTIKLPELQTFNDAIKKNVEEKIEDLGDLIEIQSVTVSYVKLPESTESRINAFNAKVMEARQAVVDISIAKAQATANNELADSLDDPNVLVSKCLDGMISGDIDAPAGFQCWSGTNGSVVIPATK